MCFWDSRRVLVTGHTGFKGSWLSLWLAIQGARVCGFALRPSTMPNLFDEARISDEMSSEIGDIRDLEYVKKIVREFEPEIIFHLAAQPLVRASYEDPVGTYLTNVQGTVNLLEAARSTASIRAIVVITTDKCYENKEWVWAYREIDQLGGYDPYSNSKACAELAVSSYRSSFFNPKQYSEHHVSIASARAGNVIGGGDWSQDRLIPDIVRAISHKQIVRIRNPRAVRPWQHVLEPLYGYQKLAEKMVLSGPGFGTSWNFGPYDSDIVVESVVRQFCVEWGDESCWEIDNEKHVHEAGTLKLDWSKAAHFLEWCPVLSLEEAIRLTANWYKRQARGEDARSLMIEQIKLFALRAQSHVPGTSSAVANITGESSYQ